MNGVLQDNTEMTNYCKTLGEPYNMTINVFTRLTQDDYLEVFVANKDSDDNVTFDKLHIRAFSIFTN